MPRSPDPYSFPDILAMIRGEATVSGSVMGATTTANVGKYEVPLGAPMAYYPVGGEYLDALLPDDYRAMVGLPKKQR